MSSCNKSNKTFSGKLTVKSQYFKEVKQTYQVKHTIGINSEARNRKIDFRISKKGLIYMHIIACNSKPKGSSTKHMQEPVP